MTDDSYVRAIRMEDEAFRRRLAAAQINAEDNLLVEQRVRREGQLTGLIDRWDREKRQRPR